MADYTPNRLAMSSRGISVQGLDELMARLQAMGAQGIEHLETALWAGANVIAQDAKLKAPRSDAATLANSITVETVEKSASGVTMKVGPQVEYGVYVEFGTGIYAEFNNGRKTPWTYKNSSGHFVTTRGMRPRPYLRPAFDEQRAAAEATIARVLQRLLEAR